MNKMGLKPVAGINRVTIKKGKAVIYCLKLSLLSASMILMFGNPQEMKVPISCSENPIWMDFKVERMNLVTSNLQ